MTELPEVQPYFLPCAPERTPYGDGTALRIGHDDSLGEFLVLDSGQVVFVVDGHASLVNSSREHLRDSLLLIAQAQAAARNQDPTKQDVLRVEQAMRRVDPMAWDTPGSCWPNIVEEARLMAD